MGKLTEDMAGKLDKRHDDVVNALREEWRALMAYPPSEDRTTSANHLLDRANALGIGKLDS